MPDTEATVRSLQALLWMGLPVLAGFLSWQFGFSRLENGKAKAAKLGRVISRVGLFASAAPLMIIVVWVAPLPAGEAAVLPLVGIVVHGCGALAGYVTARALGRRGKGRAAFLLGGGCSNVLTFGGVTIVLFLRTDADPNAEAALGQMGIYRFFESPLYFLVVWPLAATIAGSDDGATWKDNFRRAISGPTMFPVVGIFLGSLLNVSDVPRPEMFDGVGRILVLVNVILFGFTVGLELRGASPRKHLRECLLISSIKFVVMPVLGVGLAYALGFRGSTLQVVLICSSMPVAFMAVVGAALYRLDDDLVASFWLVSTVAMLLVVPLIALALPWIAAWD
ncbi:MAG: AEC family transporter [Planctomycetota bacterium]